ncbi:MAG: crossover junction endodeoxyribonuclease [Deltaproteobacteria bacterium]|nr:MAG: crossover junction endodeoxyribonuclease [Deltaproteobacteria bacterium]
MARIIGIDPGLAATGVAVVRGHGIKVEGYSFGSINTSKKNSLPRRLHLIYTELSRVLTAETPDLMVVEDVFSLEKYPGAGITLGKVTGVILLAGYEHRIPVVEISVRTAKQILTGNGNAGKAQLEKAVRHELNREVPIRPFHSSDALALALIGMYRYSR